MSGLSMERSSSLAEVHVVVEDSAILLIDSISSGSGHVCTAYSQKFRHIYVTRHISMTCIKYKWKSRFSNEDMYKVQTNKTQSDEFYNMLSFSDLEIKNSAETILLGFGGRST